jgi:hypothetical protein
VTATAIAQMPATGAVSRASWARSAAGKAFLAVATAVPSASSAYSAARVSAAAVSHGYGCSAACQPPELTRCRITSGAMASPATMTAAHQPTASHSDYL